MRGEARSHFLGDETNLHCLLLARAFGKLYDLGTFPGMRLNASDRSLVEGEFARVGNIRSLLDVLDQVEGFHEFGHPQNFYRRELIQVDVGDGRIREAWTYVYCDEPRPPAASPPVTGASITGSGRRSSRSWRLHTTRARSSGLQRT